MQILKSFVSDIACLGLLASAPMFLEAEVMQDSVLVRGVDPRDHDAAMPDGIRDAYLTSLSRFPTISDCLDATHEYRVRWEEMISSTDIEVCFAWIANKASNQNEFVETLEKLGGNVLVIPTDWLSLRMHGSHGDGFIISTSWSLRQGDVAGALPRNLEGNQVVRSAYGMTVNSYATLDFRILTTSVGFSVN